jgi:large subunit ribosomal protein L23
MGIIKKPVITEKMSTQSEKQNVFAFVVDMDANKLQIRKAVEEQYGVTVTRVNTMNYAGKSKSRFTKTGVVSGSRPDFKKAVVYVAEGDTIDFYSNI